MTVKKYTGSHVNAFLSNKVNTSDMDSLDKIINRKQGEAIYIYNFKENKAEYIKGYDELFGLKNEGLNIIKLNELFAPFFKDFVNEYHDRIFLEIYNDKKALDTFSSKVISNLIGFDFPVMVHIQVFKTDENGNLLSIIGRNSTKPSLKTSDIIQYSFNGEFSEDFLYKVNHNLDYSQAVSEKMIRILEAIEKGSDLNTIARTIGYKASQVENLISKFKSDFNLKEEKDLIDFAHKNFLLPNQFKTYFK